jgi:uncharacterized membrane protein YkvA (DUF1232 family)
VLFFLAALLYSLFPMDIIPDLLVPIGWVDDLGVWALAIAAEVFLARRAVRKKH